MPLDTTRPHPAKWSTKRSPLSRTSVVIGPLSFPGSVDAFLRVAQLGSSSVRYELALFDGETGEPAAVGWFVHVFVDAQTRRPSEITDQMRALFERLQVA